VYLYSIITIWTLNKIKEKEKKKNDDRERSTKAPSSSAWNSTETVAYTPVSNEAQAGKDIQIALHAYSKVKYSI